MLRRYCILFLLLCTIKATAQTAAIDSLKKKIATAKDNTEKSVFLQALCRLNGAMPADTFGSYAAQFFQVALLQKDDPGIWEAEYMYALSLQQRSQTDSSLLICGRLLKSIRELHKNFAVYHQVLGLQVICLTKQNKIKEATDLVYRVLASAERYNDLDGQINAYYLLTIVRGQLNNFDDPKATDTYLRQCIVWYKKAISLFKDSSYYRKYDKILNSLAITYFQLPTSDYDSAFYYANAAFRYAKEQDHLRVMATSNSLKANMFLALKKQDSALYYYKQEIALEQQIGDPERIAMSYSALRNVYRSRKEYQKALSYDLMERDYCVANHIAVDPVVFADLAHDYQSLGNYEAYGNMLDTLLSIKDSLYQANSATALAEIQTKYDVQKKETTIIQQKYDLAKERYIKYGMLGLIVLLCVIAAAWYMNRKRKQVSGMREQEMEHEARTRQAVEHAKEEERKRIIADLHDDVGGGLSTIRMVSDLIAEQKEQTLQLEQYAHKISGITRDVTQRMNTIVWALNAENDTLQNLVEYIREYGFSFFENSSIAFRCSLPVLEPHIQLSGLQRKNIFLCVKEALNNVYKHSGATDTWIDIDLSDGLLTVSVHDNGKGISNENPFSNGLKNMDKRMKEINGEITFDTGSGTHISLRIHVG